MKITIIAWLKVYVKCACGIWGLELWALHGKIALPFTVLRPGKIILYLLGKLLGKFCVEINQIFREIINWIFCSFVKSISCRDFYEIARKPGQRKYKSVAKQQISFITKLSNCKKRDLKLFQMRTSSIRPCQTHFTMARKKTFQQAPKKSLVKTKRRCPL